MIDFLLSVDVATDSVVQSAVRKHFPTATILAIAHRLDTVADYDRSDFNVCLVKAKLFEICRLKYRQEW